MENIENHIHIDHSKSEVIFDNTNRPITLKVMNSLNISYVFFFCFVLFCVFLGVTLEVPHYFYFIFFRQDDIL